MFNMMKVAMIVALATMVAPEVKEGYVLEGYTGWAYYKRDWTGKPAYWYENGQKQGFAMTLS